MELRLPLRLVAVFIFLCQLKGSSAVTPVFVKKGDDLLLNITEADIPEKFNLFYWKFNNKTKVAFNESGKPKVFDNNTHFSEENFSVKLKNLAEADSGVYTAQVMGDKDQTLAEYNVTVQAPVSPVGLTVDSVSNSSDSCVLTVTCRTQDSHINSTFRCDNQTCSQEGGERSEVTTSGASLHVYLVNDSIICNHSNQVSWTKNMTNIQDFCPQHAAIHVAAVVILALLVLTGIVVCIRQRRKNKSENIETTGHASQVGTTTQPAYALFIKSKILSN